jgi:RNA polymerase sigma-70 factor, ECF subfamily
VSPPAVANRPFLISDLIDSAKSDVMPLKAISGNAEPSELEALFRDNYKVIFRVAYRLTGSESDAEDVLQTIFLRLTPNKELRDLSPNPQGYLYRAAVNASVDLIRSRARANAVPLDVADFDKSATSSVATPADNFSDVELRELIRQAVAKLEGRAASVFALRYFEGYDNAQIAETLGTSALVVAVTLHRARTRLRKEIGSFLEKHHEAK